MLFYGTRDFFPPHIWKGALGHKGLIVSSVPNAMGGTMSEAWREGKKNSNNNQLFLPNSVICYRNQTRVPLCFKVHISLTWASCMPKAISDLQRVRGAHRRDFWFKKGGVWKPIARPDVNSLSRGSRHDTARVLLPFHHADAPRTVSQWRWLQSGPGRYITDLLCQEGFVDSLVEITDHLTLFQGCLSTPKSWQSCTSADLWHSHLGHLPSMKTGSTTLVENCSLRKINAATWLAEKWELDDRFPF